MMTYCTGYKVRLNNDKDIYIMCELILCGVRSKRQLHVQVNLLPEGGFHEKD